MSEIDESGSPPDLKASLSRWLAGEGYPLEYFTAAAFRSAGLDVHQGEYFRPEGSDKPREVDVVAQATFRSDHRFVRIETVVECKWSGNKPLVIFTSPRAYMMPSACISQTISSDVGDALMWLLRGNEAVRNLKSFDTPELPGFGGRQAFGGSDKFYAAMAGVTAACSAFTKKADRGFEQAEFVQQFGLITLPVVVVDGQIFEARYDEETNMIETVEVDRSRCHWRGAPDWPLIATVDVVSRAALTDFATQRAADCEVLGPLLVEQLNSLLEAYGAEDRKIIFGSRGPSGRGGLPRLLRVLFDLAEKKNQPRIEDGS